MSELSIVVESGYGDAATCHRSQPTSTFREPTVYITGMDKGENDVLRDSSVVPTTNGTNVLDDLMRFEVVLQHQLVGEGLPADQVFVDVRERHTVLKNVSSVLGDLDETARSRSHYISKMIAAAAVGLFDAALNYLWDELVHELRRRVVGFDLKYFYDIAAGSSDLRKHLNTEDDLTRIDDQSLLRACREIGLLTDVGFQRLDHIRFMRNHASAAHPNQVILTGLDLANWLQVCIREVITQPPDTVTAQTGRLLANIKDHRIEESAVREAAAFFNRLPTDRADTLANGLYGLYTDPGRTAVVADNVLMLWPKLWPFVSEDTKHGYGLRHARAIASAETGTATAARELIDLVDGAVYLTDDIRAIELTQALEDLNVVHRGINNFYNEVAPARRVRDLVGENGDAPPAVRPQYIRTIAEMFLGNGYGVSWAAESLYHEMLQALDGHAAGTVLRLCIVPVFSSLLSSSTGANQWLKLLDLIEPKLTSNVDRALMLAVRAFPGKPYQLADDSKIKRLAKAANP